jgi:hypothetical protein
VSKTRELKKRYGMKKLENQFCGAYVSARAALLAGPAMIN